MNDEKKPNRLIAQPDGMAYISVKSRATISEMIRRGDLPKPIARGNRRYWLESDLEAYIDGLAAKREA